MEQAIDAIMIGINVTILAICARLYVVYSNTISFAKNAPVLRLDAECIDKVRAGHNYGCVKIQGVVRPFGDAIVSFGMSNVKGVMQIIELRAAGGRDVFNYWYEGERTVRNMFNAVPFAVEVSGGAITVADPRNFDVIDLKVTTDAYITATTVMDNMFMPYMSFYRSIHLMERILENGTMVTVIGNLGMNTNGTSMVFKPPANLLYCITNKDISGIVNDMKIIRAGYGLTCVLFGLVTVIVVSLMINKYNNRRNTRRR